MNVCLCLFISYHHISSYMHPRIFYSNMLLRKTVLHSYQQCLYELKLCLRLVKSLLNHLYFGGAMFVHFVEFPFTRFYDPKNVKKILRIVWHCNAINKLQKDLYHGEPANYWQSTNINPPPIKNDLRFIFSAIVVIFLLAWSHEKYLFS